MTARLAGSSADIRVAHVLPVTEVEGPGRRTAIWVQGCSIRCLGCFNPHMWAATGGQLHSPGELLQQALAAGVEGITLLGGEPFDQAPALGQLGAAAQAAGLTVMTFTGHTLEALRVLERQAVPGIGALLQHTDLLVDGPFMAHLVDRERPWTGSTNQRFHHLSGRYAALAETLTRTPDRLEIVVRGGGEVSVNGWAEPQALEHLLEALGHRVDRAKRRST